MNKRNNSRRAQPRRNALVIALAVGLGFSGFAFGQATTGTIFGTAPSAAGQTVKVVGQSGTTRTVSVSADGRYAVSNLPVGTYTVTLSSNGSTVSTRNNVGITVGGGTEVDFAAASAQNATELGGVNVTANALPAIDVTDVNSSTVITSQQLDKLPISHNAEAIALLAPGAVLGSAYFGNYISFGGSSVTENAYYINGFNSTDPLSGFGGMTLPYGAIEQQQMLTGGYGAKYGRSDGGVISQVGKRGTNDWHFGAMWRWTPRSLRGNPVDRYYPAGPSSRGGTLLNYNKDNGSWQNQYAAYMGGPLIRDRLFIFAAAQWTETKGSSVGSISQPLKTFSQSKSPEYYVKLDWNINDNNILEVTGVRTSSASSSSTYGYSYETHKGGAFVSDGTQNKNTDKLWLVKYTGYLTDNITLSAMYGKLHHTYYSNSPGYDPTFMYILGAEDQNTNLTPGNKPVRNTQTILNFADPRHKALNSNLRLDLSWRIGDHTITAGIDNQDVYDYNDGTAMAGSTGYAWEYDTTTDADTYIVGGPGSDPDWQNKLWVKNPGAYPGGAAGPDGKGYFVDKYIFSNEASVKTTQRAQYIEDEWQINDRWRVRIGLRNDQFTNYNPNGVSYLRLTSPQLAPRLGFTWDVNGDSSFKVYGNAGRYYLAMPTSVALRSASGSLYTRQYFTYTGIDSSGYPQNLTSVDTSRGVGAPISVNNEYGIPRDPLTATATNLTSEYQDEFILGFDKRLNDAWTYGAKATVRKLRNGIDDVGDQFAIGDKMVAMGLITPAEKMDLINAAVIPASVLFNPNKTNIFRITNPNGGYYVVPMSMDDFGFNTEMKRSYWGLDLYLEHPFDGKWFAKITYTLSKSYGNSEGQVRSDIGQSDVSATVDWDYAQVMDYANGNLANDRRHQLKAYGSYQFTPDWMFSGNVLVTSGYPVTCLGYYGSEQNNPGLGYGAYYHFCDGKPFPPGTQHNPWEYSLDLGVQYSPSWADHKLRVALNVTNVFDRQSIRQRYPSYAGGNANYPTVEGGGIPLAFTPPRTATLSVSYDF